MKGVCVCVCGGGVGGGYRALKVENEQRASSHRRSDHVKHRDVCVRAGERERDTEREKEKQGLNISTQPSQQRHFHSRWSGSAAIWRPRWPDNLRYLQTPNFV